MIKRSFAIFLSVLVLAPAGAFAQQSKAGIVTTLEGNVSARRVALPTPVSLKFKDDVFLQDTVTTGDKSLARMLLGGKAVVTVRERSVLKITEVPGRSTIELETGKFALAVAREKMRPGEEIQIRTPNAIAGVRGTVVITEVNRQSAQVGGAAPAVLTNFYVMRGTINAQPLDPTTRQPTGTPLQVGPLHAYSQAGNAPPSIAPVPPEQVAQITAGLQPSGPKGGEDAGQEQVKAQAVQTAVTLVAALTGGPTEDGSVLSAVVAPPSSDSLIASATTETTTVPVIPPVAEAVAAQEAAAEEPVAASAEEESGAVEEVAAEETEEEKVAKKALITGTFTVAPNTTFHTFTGTFTSTATTPLFTFDGATVTQTGSENLIEVDSAASVSLAGTLLKVVNSTVTSGQGLLAIAGKLTNTSLDPLLTFAGSTVNVDGKLVGFEGSGGELTLAGPLFTASGNSSITSLGNTIDVHSVLKSTTTGALVQLDSSSLAAGTSGSSAHFLRLIASDSPGTTGPDSTMSLAGQLFSATGSTVTTKASFAEVINGATLTTSGTNPLIDLTNTTLNVGQTGSNSDVFVVFGTGGPSGTSGAKATVAGGLLRLTGGTSNVTGGYLQAAAGGVLDSTHPSAALVSIDGGTHSVATNTSAAALRVKGRDANRTTQTITESVSPFETAVSVSGVTLDADQPVQHSGSGAFVEVKGGASVSAATVVSVDTALLAASAPLIDLKAASTLTSTAAALDLVQKAKLTSVGPVFRVDGATLTQTTGDLIKVRSGSLLQVNGNLLSIINGGKIQILNGTALNVTGGSVVKITGAFAAFSGSGTNTFSIANTACSGTCISHGNVNFSGNVNFTSSSSPVTGGSITYSGGDAAAIVTDNGSQVFIGPGPFFRPSGG